MKDHFVGIRALPGFCPKDYKLLITAVTFTLIFTLIFIPTVQAEDEQDTGRPQLSIQGAIYDFGTTVEGKKITHNFVLQNRGTSVLEIQKVKTG